MRRLIFAVILGWGCGGGDNFIPPDMTAAVDMTRTGDLSVQLTCDVVAQDCPGTEACTFVQAAGLVTMDGHACIAPRGNNMEDQPCTRVAFGDDDCAKGLVCTLRGSGPTDLLCRKWCHADSDCKLGERCTGQVSQTFPMDGICLPPCTPFSTDCAAPKSCAELLQLTSSTASRLVFSFVCRTTGTAALGAACMSDFDCVADAACIAIDPTNPAAGGACRPLCDSTHLCPGDNDAGAPAADGGLSCMPIPRLSTGICG
jgi:hypothetical protein